MKPPSCFRDLAGFSNRQKRLQQNRRYAVEIHNDHYKGATETSTDSLRAKFFNFVSVYYFD
jgi:hypothetical protein